MTNLFKIGFASLAIVSLPLVASAANLDRQLEFGMSGSDVSTLQTFLALDTSIYPQGLVTGYFGPLTKAAVSNFQNKNGIAMVGRVGPITLLAINTKMNNGAGKVGSDRVAPTIGQLNVDRMSTSATLSWSTSEPTSAIVYYATTPLVVSEAGANLGLTISGTSFLINSDLRASHSGTITGLKSNTLYYYIVYVRDASGNASVTTQASFQTPA